MIEEGWRVISSFSTLPVFFILLSVRIIYTNFVEYDRHFLSTYFLVDPFILPYWFYSIQRELIDIFSIIVYFSSTFCPTLGHHRGRIYYKSDVTFIKVNATHCNGPDALLLTAKGSTRKYEDKKCLLYSTKFVLMKKGWQNIHAYIYIYVYIYVWLNIIDIFCLNRFC